MKLRYLFAAALALGSSSALAVGMSCYVDTPAYDEFTPGICLSTVHGAKTATASFRIDDLPANYYVDWKKPACSNTGAGICTAVIKVFQPYEAIANVIDLDTGIVTEVSAIANLENGN